LPARAGPNHAGFLQKSLIRLAETNQPHYIKPLISNRTNVVLSAPSRRRGGEGMFLERFGKSGLGKSGLGKSGLGKPLIVWPPSMGSFSNLRRRNAKA
jgi:hypothetical protein